MNKRFKKVISSVLAAVMTLGVVSVANVSSVFAGTNVYELYYYSSTNSNGKTETKQENTKKDDTEYFTMNGTSSADSSTDNNLNATDLITPYGTTSKVTPPKFLKADGSLALQFTVSGTADIEVVWSTKTASNCTSTTLALTDSAEDPTVTVLQDADGNDLSSGKTAWVTGYAKNLDAGTYKLYRKTGQEGRIAYIKVTETTSDITYENTITGNFTAPEGANISEFTLTYNNRNYTANVTGNTYTVVVDKEISDGATLTPSCTGYATDSTVTVSNLTETDDSIATAVKNTATGSAVVFTELQTYSVTATVKDENGSPIKDAIVYYAKDGTVEDTKTSYTTLADGKFTIDGFTENADVYVKVDDYWTIHKNYTATTEEDITLEPVTVKAKTDTDTTKFSTANFIRPTSYAGEKEWSRTTIRNEYTSNDFKFKGNGANLYLDTGSTGLQSAAGSDGTEISYKPSVDGKITLGIKPAGTVDSNKTRGFSVNGTDMMFTSSSDKSKFTYFTYNAPKNETVTFKVKGANMSNIDYIEFTPYDEDVENAPLFEYEDTQNIDGNLYIIGKIKKGDIDKVTEVGFISSISASKNMSTSEVATKIVTSDDTTLIGESADYYYAATKIAVDSGTSTIKITPYSILSGSTDIIRGTLNSYTVS